jgi:predicted DNA-binding protein YlxM (UPF0122 family)
MSEHELNTDKDKPYRDETVLRRLYHDEQLPLAEIAEACGCGEKTIYRWMDKLGVEIGRDKPYQDEDTLQVLYHDENLTLAEVADECDCTVLTVRRWMDKFGIERRDSSAAHFQDKRLLDENLLRGLYHGERMTITEVGEELDIDRMAIHRALKYHNIERRDTAEYNRQRHPTFANTMGYAIAHCGVENKSVRIHRLVAVAEHGFDAVINKVVHHKNGVKFDNRPRNLRVMDKKDHVIHHNLKRGGQQSWQNE